MPFEGLPSQVKFDRIPSAFFSELLLQIDDLNELKLTIYFLWRLDRMEGDFRYLTEADILADDRFISGLANSPEAGAPALTESLSRCVNRETLLKAEVKRKRESVPVYFFNSPKGRAAVEAIQNGEWRPVDDASTPVELTPERPNIYTMYEQNIGPITPLLAETLADAEDDYPVNWIEEAFRIAVEKNVRNWRYVEAILRRWHERGYDVREDRRDPEEDLQKYKTWED